MKTLFTVKPKDRNDIPGTMEFESHVFDIKKLMQASLGKNGYTIETNFDQSSVLYPKMFTFDYVSGIPVSHAPREVIDAFFDAIENTGICLSKYDVHITIE
jgi:hypothetical protein